MNSLDIFSINELHLHIDDLIKDAEKGVLTLITKEDRPAFLAIPFSSRLLRYGINRSIAIHLFEAGLITLAQGALISVLSIEDFIELLGEVEIPVVDYPPEELEEELED
jgi:predicted HTH domain antitoxin